MTFSCQELEEEHEYLNRELQQVSMEKKHLEDKVQVLERRLSGSDAEDTVRALVAPVQVFTLTTTLLATSWTEHCSNINLIQKSFSETWIEK